MIPDNRFLKQQWAWKHLGVEAPPPRPGDPPHQTKPIPPEAPDIVVAVVDSGVNEHEDLATLLPAHSVIAGDTRDDDDHGTALAGTICGITNFRSLVGGTSKVKILPVKFCSQQDPPSAANAAKAIHFALENKAKVIVLAWDCGYKSVELDSAIDAATYLALIVAAAGNHAMDNDRHPNWPANYSQTKSHVITVMATDKNDERASFSNYGRTTVDMAAPGVDILTTVPYYGTPVAGSMIPVGYRYHRGTSAATAHVARLAALILARNPTWTPAQLKQHLRTKARRVPSKLSRFCVSGGIADYRLAI